MQENRTCTQSIHDSRESRGLRSVVDESSFCACVRKIQ